MNNRQIFLQHVAQTSDAPLAIETVKAKGCNFWDKDGKKYLDLIAGISVCNVGHCNDEVVAAIQQQAATYMHLMVYGEFVQSPQVAYAKLLTDHLPHSLNSLYFTNSGAEATEGAMKLAKRVTGRTNIIAFNKSYHGSTQGALSMLGDEYWRNAYRPLLPGIFHFDYGSEDVLHAIDEQTAAVFVEPVQAESGVTVPPKGWLYQLQEKCREKGALLVVDEIQTGFGRTGSLWAFEKAGIEPDILLLGKALGGGMPLGAFIADREKMFQLAVNPVLGHITTFGGHPVCCAAGKAAFEFLLKGNYIEDAAKNVTSMVAALKHEAILQINHCGAWASVEFSNFEINKKIIDRCIEKGLLTDWFLFAPQKLRIAPPLIISAEEAKQAAVIIQSAIDELIKES